MMLDQARSLLDSLAASPDATNAGAQWKSLHTLLKKAPCDQMRLARAIAERNVEAMRRIVDECASAPAPAGRGGGTPAATAEAESGARPAPPPQVTIRAEKPTPQQLKTALAAFKKRLKLTKLDQESRLGRSPLSAGSKSAVIAILPPNTYPRVYWEELEKQGHIRNTGGGFYELVETTKPVRGAAAKSQAASSEQPQSPGAGEQAAAEQSAADQDSDDTSDAEAQAAE